MPSLLGLRGSLAATVTFVLFALALTPAAAQPADYAAEYKLYNEALAAGDNAAAAEHALNAWQLAEVTLGDHATTAVLAYNYGYHMLFADPVAAYPAFERAAELQDEGLADLPVADLRIFYAYTKFHQGGRNYRDARRLRNALKARDSAVDSPSFDAARIWLELAFDDLSNKRYRNATESGRAAEAYYAAVAPENYRAKAQAIMVAAAAEILPASRSRYAVENAHNEFVRAIDLFPLQEGIDTYDSVLAKLLAWDFASHALLVSMLGEYRAERMAKNWPRASTKMKRFLTADECNTKWVERIPPTFPDQAADDLNVGAVVIGFNIDADGLVRDVRILAEVPTDVFGESVLQSVKKWRHEVPIDPRPECSQNLLTFISFQY